MSTNKLAALAAQLTRQPRTKAAKPANSVASQPNPTPAGKNSDLFPVNAHVRLDEADDAHLTGVLMAGLMRHGLRAGHNSVSRANIFRYALFQWKEVTAEEVRRISANCEKMSDADSSPNAEVVAITVRLTEDEGKHLTTLSSELIKRGLRPGHNGVNNANVLRFAIQRWDKVTADDAKQFGQQCEQWRAFSLNARRKRKKERTKRDSAARE